MNTTSLVELFTQLSILSLLVEGLTQVIKDLLPQKLESLIPTRWISVGLSAGIAVTWGIDLTILLNHQVDLSGSVLTGIIASRGANFINDLSDKFMPKKP